MVKMRVSDLSVNYETSSGDVHALENVDFQLEDNESIGIAGESGCGKSVGAMSIMRLVSSPPGRIVLSLIHI